jgi:hypothetical protein
MKRLLVLLSAMAMVACASQAAKAVNLLTNGSLDDVVPTEIVPGFFLPKPAVWQNLGTRTITGPYEDEMSSEPWAGPAPTPVTTGGNGLPGPDGCDGLDCAVFFKPFSGNLATNGAATGSLQQAVPGTAGTTYVFGGWAGAEANALMARAVFALDFLNGGGGTISSSELDLLPTLLVPNGQPFNYKYFAVAGVAPAGTASVQGRISMIGALGNPAGGGQAFVIDDFTLDTVVPEPTTAVLGLLSVLGMFGTVRRR